MSIMWVFYSFGKAVQNIRQGAFVNLISIGTVALTLVLVNVFLIVFLNLGQFLNRWENIGVTVFLDDTISSEDITRLRGRISVFTEVESVEYISKEEALHILQDTLQTDDTLFKGLVINPLPDSLEIRFKREFLSFNRVENFVANINGFEGVTDIHYDKEGIKRFSTFLHSFGIGGLTLGVGLLLTAILIISNTTRLSLYARREELHIMGFMGATNLFIKAPILMEGLIRGLLGGFLAVGLSYAIYQISMLIIETLPNPYLRGLTLVFLPFDLVLGIIIIGILVGVFGTMVSLRRFSRI